MKFCKKQQFHNGQQNDTEQRSRIKFYLKIGKNTTKTFDLMKLILEGK